MRQLSPLIDSLWYLRDNDGYEMNGDADVRVRLADGTLAEVADKRGLAAALVDYPPAAT